MSARDHFLAEFARIAPELAAPGAPWLDQTRRDAIDAFAASGLPTQREEDWKYTSLAALERRPFAPPPPGPRRIEPAAVAAHALAGADLLVFVDGRYAPDMSRLGALPAGATVISLGEALRRDDIADDLARSAAVFPSALAMLNTAFMSDGAYIALAPGTVLARPIQLLSVVTVADAAIHLRHFVRAGADSRACIIEHYVGMPDAPYLTNVASDIAVGARARIEHGRLQDEGRKAIHLATVTVTQRSGADFASNAFAFGAALARADIGVTLAAEDARCALNGLYVAGGRQHVDHHTRIDHLYPRGTSREFYKGIVDGAARAVFNGRVVVHAGAQRTDARQTNRNLLLSDAAEVDSKPQLEIYADDVKCSHGATVGQLDAEQMLYLRSRGIGEATARAMLTRAFAAEVLDRVAFAPLRASIEGRLGGGAAEAQLAS